MFKCDEDTKTFIANLITVFKVIATVMPSKMPLLAGTFLSLEKGMNTNAHLLTDDILLSYQNLVTTKDRLFEQAAEVRTTKPLEGAQGPPPEDFRDLSVTPLPEDLNDVKPYLRKNKDRGGFASVYEYLDVQFRLLREDFIAPLREGISEYKYSSAKRRNQNLRIYRGVRFVSVRGSDQGINYRIQFDTRPFKRVRWEVSKRLIFGSLLALSMDEFETVIFATVLDRDSKNLNGGFLDITFVEGTPDEDKLKFRTEGGLYVMAETLAYFEAYVHVLKGLQLFHDTNFPFEKHLVYCQSDIAPPMYAQRSDDFDLSCITNKKDARLSNVCVEDLGFDASQFKALSLALKNEFALIQGPPGTGKTFVGLKIAQVLMNNLDLWFSNGNEKIGSPMLVVCYTNHALDQFLEGIMAFVDSRDIIRVGGRCSNEKIQELNLKKRRQEMRESRGFSKQAYYGMRDARHEMEELKKEMDQYANDRENMYNTSYLLNERDMDNCNIISNDHLYQLDNLRDFWPKDSKTYHWSTIREWLGLGWLNELRVKKKQEKADQDVAIQGEVEAMHAARELDGDRPVANVVEIESVDETAMNATKEGDWETVENKKNKWRKARFELGKTDCMSEQEVAKVDDIMSLDFKQRWSLYRYWRKLFEKNLADKCEKRLKEYERLLRNYKELKFQQEKEVMHQAKVIGMTTSGAARYIQVLKDLKVKVVIIEEAAEVLEGHIVTSLSEHCQHLILIGDHKQLKPNPSVYALAKYYKLDLSLFERMVNNKVDCACLELQHRMRPQISRLLRFIYPNLKDHEVVSNYPNAKGVSSNVLFLNHDNKESCDAEGRSHSNVYEAEMAKNLCHHFLKQSYKAEQITVIALYTGQLFEIKRLMDKTRFEGVRLTTVDNYQGEENDIVIVSLVRSNDEQKIGFVGIDNRVCVALSRAKIGLYVIGNFEMMVSKSSLWNKIVMQAKADGLFDDKMTLVCPNHPEDGGVEARTADDFKMCPEGGCMKPCEYRLLCGHVCPKVCHPYDPKHKLIFCTKKCPKKCIEGHQCTGVCSQDCPSCTVLVKKTMPWCNHQQMIPCCVNPRNRRCTFKVTKELECGHKGEFECGDSINECREPCNEKLECGHTCKGSCVKCYQGKLHVDCREKCKRPQICEHVCTGFCSSCPPCPKKCQHSCAHSTCPLICGDPCKPCMEPCARRCEHMECTKLCHELCDTDPCSEPCNLLLQCRHECLGLCGEKCPDVCKQCNEEKFAELKVTFLGYEDEEDARFVQLQDCNHILEVKGLDMWMKQGDQATNAAIKLKTCPICSTPISKSTRYGDTIKLVRHDVNSIKKKLFGDEMSAKDYSRRLTRLKRIIENSDSKPQKGVTPGARPNGVVRLQRERNNPTEGRILDCPLRNQQKAFMLFVRNRVYDFLNSDKNEATTEVYRGFFTQLEAMEKFMKFQQENNKFVQHHEKKSVVNDFFEWLTKWRRTFSKQNEIDFNQELKRIKFMASFWNKKSSFDAILNKKSSFDHEDDFEIAVDILKTNRKLSPDQESFLNETMKKIPGLKISEEERLMVVKAMDLGKGHWFKCPEGMYLKYEYLSTV